MYDIAIYFSGILGQKCSIIGPIKYLYTKEIIINVIPLLACFFCTNADRSALSNAFHVAFAYISLGFIHKIANTAHIVPTIVVRSIRNPITNSVSKSHPPRQNFANQ